MDTVADLASPTGQWPEAIHPRTHGGCMGDGQHVWAAAEWVMMIRHCFVREEGDRLILCQGIAKRWLEKRASISFGPAPTSFGTLTVNICTDNHQIKVSWEADWHSSSPVIEVRMPNFSPAILQTGETTVLFTKEAE